MPWNVKKVKFVEVIQFALKAKRKTFLDFFFIKYGVLEDEKNWILKVEKMLQSIMLFYVALFSPISYIDFSNKKVDY